MKKIILSACIIFLAALSMYAQNKYTISGFIKDESGEELIGATIYVPKLKSGTVTNVYGFYSLTLPSGDYNIDFSYIGYEPIQKQLSFNKDISMNVVLAESSKTIDEVVVVAERKNENIIKTEMSTVKLQAKEIKKIPALMGEIDVIKTLQLLPGVQSTGEGFSGFNVRGGSPDQNLILFDEATVYNASHLMGFFSVFNNDAVKDLKLYKGDIPAEYGGRLSSLLDIRMKEGNQKKFEATGGLGTISSRLTLETPIIKDKWSILVAGRRTYADLFLLLASDDALKSTQLYFYDLNLKTNYRINDKNRVFFSAYFGRDVFKFGDAYSFDWGNKTVTTRWNHLFSDKLFSNFSFIYSRYDYKMQMGSQSLGSKWISNLEDFKLKADFNYYPNPRNTIKFGFEIIHHHIIPGVAKSTNQTSSNTVSVPDSRALEYGLYISNEHKLTDKLAVNYGLRGSMFQNMGDATLYDFDENYETIDSTVYDKWDIYNTFSGLEPRLSLNYTLNKRSSVKASYSRTLQYMHLASNSTAGSPLDVWIPSTPNINPQLADQIAVGYFRNFLNNTLETSVEIYYKNMDNQIDFKDFADLNLNAEYESEFRTGDAWSYGAEFLIRKQQGNFTGWVSYTLSKATRKIPTINESKVYSSSYDRPHNISVVGSYDLTKRLNVSATWVYASGAPVTFPTGRSEQGNMIIPVYSERNGVRMPDYHRMDLGITLKSKEKPNKRLKSEFNLSIYNVYNRHNAWMISFSQDEDDPTKTKAELVYLFPILPSLTWNFHF
ncbi:MAG: TonB-dependent receptor [Bacteroidales bacterium]|nr:TonB-dependent receptor [Bacteroidales bacterium]